MLHVWLLPLVLLVALALIGLFFAVRGGGDGIRKDGQCICDRKTDENDHAFPSNLE